MTVIGDSVQASFGFVPEARRVLGAGVDLRLEAAVCRRLVAPSCPGVGGRAPETALQLVRARGAALGPVVVVNVGYNDDPRVYDRAPCSRRCAPPACAAWCG